MSESASRMTDGSFRVKASIFSPVDLKSEPWERMKARSVVKANYHSTVLVRYERSYKGRTSPTSSAQ